MEQLGEVIALLAMLYKEVQRAMGRMGGDIAEKDEAVGNTRTPGNDEVKWACIKLIRYVPRPVSTEYSCRSRLACCNERLT